MRRCLAASCLLAVLATPLLCQAEAAEALARSLAELADRGVIEPSEPGDDGLAPGATIKASAHDASSWLRVEGPGIERVIPPNDAPPLASASAAARHEPGSTFWPAAPTPLRQACLQRFLF